MIQKCWQFDLWFLCLFLNPICTSGSSQFTYYWSIFENQAIFDSARFTKCNKCYSSLYYCESRMLKILQARLRQYMNHELPDVQAGFRKGRRTRDQIANICWIIKKWWSRKFLENFCFIDYVKAFEYVDHNKLWKILKEMGISDHLTCLLRNLYAGQEATVRTGHGTTDWFQIGKRVHRGCVLSPCLFNLYAENIMWNARQESTSWSQDCWEKYQ